MNETLIHLPVYEPAGRDVRLDERDLLQHLLIIGATGSGKSTLLNRIMSQLIARPDTGLLIFDAKQDDTVDRVAQICRQNRREFAVLGTHGTHHLDLFAPLRSLADVDDMVQRLLAGTQNMGTDNEFWNEMREAMLDAALTLLVTEGTPVKFEPAVNLMSGWFFNQTNQEHIADLVDIVRRELPGRSPAERRKLQQTLNTVTMWEKVDGRTRSCVQATLVNALRPLVSLGAGRCFEPNFRPAFDVKQLVQQGGVCVASVNAMIEPALAGLFFKLVKRDFVSAVQQRRDGSGNLCGLVADELPLLVTTGDVETLATVRSRRCFVCAATQGLAILDEKLGTRQRKALLANFGSLVFMRGREDETDLCAVVHLGIIERWIKIPRPQDEGDLLSQRSKKVFRRNLICPPGTLGRLSPHQGYVALPNHERCELPLWFVPQFEEIPATPIFPLSQLVDPATGERLHQQLQAAGHERQLDDHQLQAALKLFAAPQGRKRALSKTTKFFRTHAGLMPAGLETLPLPWLKALPGILWSLRQPEWTQLPYIIREVFVTEGVLQIRFDDELQRDSADPYPSDFDRLRLAINLRLYPSCYRPLHRRHAVRLKLTRPVPAMEP